MNVFVHLICFQGIALDRITREDCCEFSELSFDNEIAKKLMGTVLSLICTVILTVENCFTNVDNGFSDCGQIMLVRYHDLCRV